MNVFKSAPFISVLYNVSSDILRCKKFGIQLISTTFRNVNTAVEGSLYTCIHQRSFPKAYSFYNTCALTNSHIRCLSNARLRGDTVNSEDPITKPQATDLVLRLTEQERKYLLTALQEFEANRVKTEYEAENVPPPTLNQLMNVGIHNAIPFVGFGFLDNFIMIIAGDYIEISLGTFITISTMAAAALGNTISDVMGIGSAWYVELMASRVGLKPPNLSPVQLDMKSARRFANLGRALGIIVGCLLGMLPLLFINTTKEEKKDDVKTEVAQ